MQLFHTDFLLLERDTLKIIENRVVLQLSKVLRSKVGDEFFVQNGLVRYRVKISLICKDSIDCIILTQINHSLKESNSSILVPILNKHDKHELIVQKLTEVGVKKISFYTADRSVVKDLSLSKLERLNKISLEALEQSYGFELPQISFIDNLSLFLKNKKLVLFDNNSDFISYKDAIIDLSDNDLVGIIGPEGGFSNKDYDMIKSNIVRMISLGNTVLRAETAAILAGWILTGNSLIKV